MKRTKKSYLLPECEIRIRVPSLFKGTDAEDWASILAKDLVDRGATSYAPIIDESVRFNNINERSWSKIEEAVEEWSKEKGFRTHRTIIELLPP
jgi:hypothetical protein